MPDSIAQEVAILPPLGGVQEGLDPALPDSLYAPTFAADMRNIRVAGGKWQARYGMELWQALPGSGSIRMLADHYEDDGTRIRLAARGDTTAAVLYDFVEGTDSAFAATSGGTSLGGATHHRFQGVTLNGAFYFTDRAEALRKYVEGASTQVSAVALPAKPAAAPGVKARTYDFLEVWAGSAPFGWTETDDTAFALEDGTSTYDSPLGGITALLDTKTNPKLKPITRNVSGESIPSNTIAMWVFNGNLPSKIQFRYGLVTATDFYVSMDMPVKEQWLPLFINVGALGTINYKQFNVYENDDAADLYLSRIALPGRLQGLYRWVYTHYDPATGRESEPSDVSNGGTPLDLSIVGTTGQAASAAAFQKAAALTFTSDSGSDASTTQVRFYRNGGVPSLTQDQATGRSVWYRVGTVLDFASQVDGATSAGATTMVLDSVTGLAVGDWLVIEKGTVSKEEYARITAINSGTRTLTFSRGLEYAHSDNVAVQMAFLDNVPNEQVDVSASIDLERDDPPTACRFVRVSPDGRLWCFGPGLNVAVSNRATPERPTDYEVFPDNVDPLTRQSPNQGWRFQINGDPTEEEIVWADFFRGEALILTQRKAYRVHAYSQQDWGPNAVEPVLRAGCIAGDTAVEIEGVLYWVAPGPRVVRWDGRGPVEDIGAKKINERLRSAPRGTWPEWYAVEHEMDDGPYYRLFISPEAGPAPEEFDISDIEWWVYLDSRLGVSGSHDALIATWPDQSGNNRHATSAGTQRPKLQVTSNLSPLGKPTLRFDGVNDRMSYAEELPPTTDGWTIYFYGNIRAKGSSQVLFEDDNTGQRPQLIVETHYGWRDALGTNGIEALDDGFQTVVWVFRPPAGSGVCEIYRNGVSLGSDTWDFTTGITVGYLLGTVSSAHPLVDYALFALVPTAHDDATRQQVEAWITDTFG